MTNNVSHKNTGSGQNNCFNQYAGQTDQGLIRKKNEDSFGVFPEQALFFVADGVGGMPAGDIASMLVVEVLPSLLELRLKEGSTEDPSESDKLTHSDIIFRLKQAVIDLSNRILTESRNHPDYAGMASTLVLVLCTENYRFIAHLGDSRAYLFKDEKLQLLTDDHTLLRHLLKAEAITQEEALHHPGKNQLVQYVGMAMAPNPDVTCIFRESGERLLLCSDGLTDMLSESEIARFLMKNSSPETSCKALIKAANLAGGRDNITVVIVE